MNWETEIKGLRNPQVKRIRKTVSGFNASFQDQDVPLNTSIPQPIGMCRKPIVEDHLYVYGMSDAGTEKRIYCGIFSKNLLHEIQHKIRNE